MLPLVSSSSDNATGVCILEKNVKRLGSAVLEHGEVLGSKVGHVAAALVRHRHLQDDHLDACTKCG